MKLIRKSLVLMLALVLLIMPATTSFAATDWLLENLSDNTLIVGTHALGLESDVFTLKNVMEAIKTLPSGIENNNMYYKSGGKWFELTAPDPSNVLTNASEQITQEIDTYVGMSSPSLNPNSVLTTFTLKEPTTEVLDGDVVEIPFIAMDQNGVQMRDFDLLNSKVLLFAGSNQENKVYFKEQADGSAKLYGKFFNRTNYSAYIGMASYIQMSDHESSLATLSEISFKVSAPGVPKSINAFAHPYAYTTGSYIECYMDEFDMFDQYDRPINTGMQRYKITVTTSDQDVVGLTTYPVTVSTTSSQGVVVTSDITNSIELTEDNSICFVGGTKGGEATITYTLVDELNKACDVVSTVAYNVLQKDITGVEFEKPENATVLMVKDYPTYYDAVNHQLTDISMGEGGVVLRFPTLLGKTEDGKLVNLPLNAIKGYTVDNDKFEVMKIFTDDYAIAATGDFGSQHTASTTLTGSIEGADGLILKATKLITASDEVPEVTDIRMYASSYKIREGLLSVEDNILSLKSLAFNELQGKMLKVYNRDGSRTNRAFIRFYAITQYQNDTGIIDKISIKKIKENQYSYQKCEISIDPDTSILYFYGTPSMGEEWEITVEAGSITKTFILKAK